MNKYYRHGDIQIFPVEKIKGEEVKHGGSFVIAHGESGHKHVITCPKMEIRFDGKGYYLHLEEDGQLSHEEHETLTIPKGIYYTSREREMDWFGLAVRQVQD